MVLTKAAMPLSINVSWQQTGGVSRCLLFKMEESVIAQQLLLKPTTNTGKLITVPGEKEDTGPMMFIGLKVTKLFFMSVYLYWHISYN